MKKRLYCPNCGAEIASIRKECGSCGYKFRKTAVPANEPDTKASEEKPESGQERQDSIDGGGEAPGDVEPGIGLKQAAAVFLSVSIILIALALAFIFLISSHFPIH